jgi:hypothetical protein
VDAPTSAFAGFGLAAGKDGRKYSIFGPFEAVACVPFLALAEAAVQAGLAPTRPNPSHYTGDGLRTFALGREIAAPELREHQRRSLVAWFFNALVMAATVFVFFTVSRQLASEAAATFVTAVFAVGALAWPYAGTFFSEPLAALLSLASFGLLLPERRGGFRFLASGAALGLGVATHVTTALFIPTFALLAWRGAGTASRSADEGRLGALAFAAGLLIPLAALGLFDWARFGNVFETGRGVDPAVAARYDYGRFVAPWRGLVGLLLSPGKGILFYCPVVILGALGWFSMRRKLPGVATAILVATVIRVGFIASRSDWHGGFAHGPRLLFTLVPFLVLPLGALVDELMNAGRRRGIVAVVAACWVCAVGQAFLVVEEPFIRQHEEKILADVRGEDVFDDDALYLDWKFAPLIGKARLRTAPWLLREVAPIPMLVGGLGLLLGGGLWLAVQPVWRKTVVRR